MHIGLDLDGVLADFMRQFILYYNERFRTHFRESDFTTYDIFEVVGCTPVEGTRILHDFYDSMYFQGILPVRGAVDAVRKLSGSHQVSVITGRPAALAEKTDVWLTHHFQNDFHHIVLGNHYALQGRSTKKSDLCRSHCIDVLVEDSPEYARECAAAGTPVYLMKQYWNRNGPLPSNVTRVHNWEDILSRIPHAIDA